MKEQKLSNFQISRWNKNLYEIGLEKVEYK